MSGSGFKRYENNNVVAYINPFSINSIGIFKPGIIAWWSAASPGFGHMILGHYPIAIILIIHEMVLNTLTGLNSAIVHSMTGDIEMAKQVLNEEWIIAYICPYIFAICDSYYRTVQLNGDYRNAVRKGYAIVSKQYSIFGINKLDNKNPILSVIWSFLVPGVGHIYINRLPVAILVPWFILVVHLSHLLPAIHHTLLGDYHNAIRTIDPQWILHLPSLYGFMMYDVYVNSLANNQINKMQQKHTLKSVYQNRDFPMDFFNHLKEKSDQ